VVSPFPPLLHRAVRPYYRTTLNTGIGTRTMAKGRKGLGASREALRDLSPALALEASLPPLTVLEAPFRAKPVNTH